MVIFYPVAISPSVEMSLHAVSNPVPLLVMVPVDSSEMPTLPTMCDCVGVPDDELNDCQLRAMKNAFAKRKIDDAATLMSDGSVAYMSVNAIFVR